MKALTILGIFALILLLVLPGAVSAADVTVSGSIAQPAPVADFSVTATNGLAPITVSFTDASTVSIGTIDTWKWEYRIADNGPWTEFGAGAQNPTNIVFSTPGTYDIRLTVSNSGGSDTKTKTHVFSAGQANDRLKTVGSGTVSGDLFVDSYSPWDNAQPTSEFTKTQEFTLPAAAVGSNVQWARLFVNTYSGSFSGQFGLTSVVALDGTTLGIETLDVWQGFPTSSPLSYPVNDHVMKTMSDYEAWYDVTNLITTATPTVTVTHSPISGYQFDGRIKGITLVVAYNDGDSDVVRYIVNHGSDWMNTASGPSPTTFDASSFPAGWSSANMKTVAHSGTDGTYTFSGGTPTKTTLLSTSYIKYNSFNIDSALTPAAINTLTFANVGSSFKVTTAALKATYTAPTADFTAAPLSGDRPLTVAFTDASTGGPTSWAWDFDNDGTVDSTAQNPSYTYNIPGTYTVKLTVSNALGTDEETKTNYITVKTPAPVAGFTYTPASGAAPLTVSFTSTSTGVINSYAWDFNNDGTTDSTLQNPTWTYSTAGTYSVKLTVNGPDYSDEELKENIITVGTPTISVNVVPDTVSFGQMVIGDNTGSTQVEVTTDGGTAWSVTASATNDGYMKDGAKTLAEAFQLKNGGGAFQAMTSPFTGFMTGTADEDRTDTANVKQVRASGDQPGSYSITLTFTGGFA
ncbi:MAG TPA: DUF3344 domain-containing protein [Methanolinea sp.]|nr:DUF3344 domain-containing protein [Methanolinea sp.]